MPRTLIDLGALDLGRDVMTESELRTLLPHAHEFAMIDGICHLDVERGEAVGYKRWSADPWWARGHVPGRPLMPGVLMVEGGAQVSTVLLKKTLGWGAERFIGLGGLENVRFRGTVTPPATLYFLSTRGSHSGSRLARYPAQCVHDGKLVMEMELLGITL
jgi:3-hydroxyacyl-[acyl-carrier-protein] dehydratase